MKVAVDISLYPLNEHYIEPIKDVIERLNGHDGIEVWTNAMSTQLFGDYDDVMDALRQEIAATFDSNPKAVFTIRILNNPATHPG
ncbi:MAG: YkoF family thiamine/hydroxymethylpyrimidine-binding protein [Woeseiaceae bacterium]|nr:YkoF family thiamine/hydroxymethylpyrimidine-binding protein [Woeseiaceae bacterium]